MVEGEFYFQTFALDELVLDESYGRVELKTLIALKRRLDFNNRIKSFRQIDIAEEIGSDQSRVSKALKRLMNDGIIEKDGLDFYFSDTFVKYAGDNKPRRKNIVPIRKPKK